MFLYIHLQYWHGELHIVNYNYSNENQTAIQKADSNRNQKHRLNVWTGRKGWTGGKVTQLDYYYPSIFNCGSPEIERLI